MSEIRELLRGTAGASEFSADLAEWLSPPRKPAFRRSMRRRTGFRNGLAFGLVCVAIFTVAHIAVTGALPGLIFLCLSTSCAVAIFLRTWIAENGSAVEEDRVRYESHRARYRAYRRRRRIWERLQHCPSCGSVMDPLSGSKGTLYEVHELVNGGRA